MNWADFILYAFIGLLCLLALIAFSIVGLIISVSRQISRTGESARETKKAVERAVQVFQVPLMVIQLLRSKKEKTSFVKRGKDDE